MFRSLVFLAIATVSPVVLPPDAPPRILAYALSASVVHAGEVVSGRVITSSNVASVEFRVANYYSVSMKKIGVGRFMMLVAVPQLPPPLHRTFPVAIIARNTRGISTERTTTITVQ
jgi:hypothetical protein